MIKNGINRSRASNSYRGNVAFVKLEHPRGALFAAALHTERPPSWTPDTRIIIDKDHPLQALNREGCAKT